MNGKQHLVVLLALLVSLPPHAAAAGKPRAPDWKKPTDALLACAESRDKPCIEEAVETLVALGSGADPAIRALLTSDNEVAVEAGLQVLARTGLQGAADFAAGLLGGEDYDFKAPVAEALGAFRGPGIVRALTGVAGSPRPFER
ncbi:MAG: HEAT repeat domain-containing protein, partial [Deltaproteobacteria bacterium]|nr:HEAT repeat domain-containing protein [Deltaproteobacteria bacterium]